MKVILRNSTILFSSKEKKEDVVIDVNNLASLSGYIINSANTYQSNASYLMYKVPVPTGYSKVTITPISEGTLIYSILRSEDAGTESTPSFCYYGEKNRNSITAETEIFLQSDAKFIYINNTTGNKIASIVFSQEFKTPLSVTDSIIKPSRGVISSVGKFVNLLGVSRTLFIQNLGYSKISVKPENSNAVIVFLNDVVEITDGGVAPICDNGYHLITEGSSTVALEIPSECKSIAITHTDTSDIYKYPTEVIVS